MASRHTNRDDPTPQDHLRRGFHRDGATRGEAKRDILTALPESTSLRVSGRFGGRLLLWARTELGVGVRTAAWFSHTAWHQIESE